MKTYVCDRCGGPAPDQDEFGGLVIARDPKGALSVIRSRIELNLYAVATNVDLCNCCAKKLVQWLKGKS